MEKVFLLLIILVLTACDNPFKKYEESFDALSAAISMGKEVENVKTLLNTIDTSNTTITTEQIGQLLDSLTIVNDNLDNPQVQAILTSYADQYGVSLNVDAGDIQIELQNLPEFTNYPDAAQKQQALDLITSILKKI